MLKVFATQVVVSKGYDNTPALRFSENGDSVRFRIGNRNAAPQNTAPQNAASAPATGAEASGNFTGYEAFGCGSFFDEN